MPIMYLYNENITCPKEQIIHKELGLTYTLFTIYKLIKNSMKPDVNSENSVDPDQLASKDQDPHCFPYNIAL